MAGGRAILLDGFALFEKDREHADEERKRDVDRFKFPKLSPGSGNAEVSKSSDKHEYFKNDQNLPHAVLLNTLAYNHR